MSTFALYGDSYIKHLGRFCHYDLKAHLLSQLRRLAMNFSRPLNGEISSSLWSCKAKTTIFRHSLLCMQNYCTISSAKSKELFTEGLTPTEIREIKATEILNNFTDGEKLKLEMLKTEYTSWKAELKEVPSHVSNYQWVKLMEKETKSSRRKYYGYLMRIEYKQEKRRQLKEERQQEKEREENMEHKTVRNETFISHVSDKKLRDPKKVRGYQSLMFGNPLVFDFAVGVQKDREVKNLMMQLHTCYGLNLDHPEPFHLHFTGIPENGDLAEVFNLSFNLQSNSSVFIDYHNEDLCEVFPKDRLVYLTPQSDRYLKYNSDDIYVIGALVDLHDTKPYTFAKAKRLGLRTACIPLDRYYRLKRKKSLTLDMVLKVMLDINFTRDWEKAMVHVPQRYWDMVKTEKLRQHWDTIEARNSKKYRDRIDTEASKQKEEAEIRNRGLG